MKILITLLITLFISSQAYAEQTMKEHCAELEREILQAHKKFTDNESTDEWVTYRDRSKSYHYLDCSDFR
tara:strand:+ start:258 stop:467 length:210 start_codon:yes stop_codon:yes gene_type:complete